MERVPFLYRHAINIDNGGRHIYYSLRQEHINLPFDDTNVVKTKMIPDTVWAHSPGYILCPRLLAKNNTQLDLQVQHRTDMICSGIFTL